MDQPAVPKAVLFDLDDTLLYSDMENAFLEHYFRLLQDYATATFDPRRLMASLLDGTRAIHAEPHPERTNEQVFAQVFAGQLGRPWPELQVFFARFYEERFPELQVYVRPHADAPRTVQAAFDANCAVVIATNPLFPARAIEHRMSWAGLDGFTFDLVTTYENMHACKPFAEYYVEIADRLNVSPSDCWMVGNDVLRDVVPAQEAGMHTFLVDEWLANSDPNVGPDRRGRLGDVYKWLTSLVS